MNRFVAICFVFLSLCKTVYADDASTKQVFQLTLSVTDAVFMSLENNHALKVQRFQPLISHTAEEQASSIFDLNLSGDLSLEKSRYSLSSGKDFTSENKENISLGANQQFITGTKIEGGLTTTHSEKAESESSRLGLTVTQAMLRGLGTEVNQIAIQQARIDTTISEHELRGYAESVVAQTETAYWDFLLAVRRVGIVERSLAIAKEQLGEVRERISVGRLAEIEQIAAEAETAIRNEALINAKSLIEKTRLKLLRLLNPPGENSLMREIKITDVPVISTIDKDPLESHVLLARRLRADLNQARFQLEKGELEIVKTRNGLLPKLDLFIDLGKTGYSSSFGGSLDIVGDGYDIKGGLSLRFPWENRSARAAEKRALLSRDQAAESIENLSQLVEVDVRGAWIEINRLREQVSATAISLRLQEAKLRAETEKFRVGKSTAFQVAQAQRDLLQAETDSVSAVVECIKANVELYRLEGSLLERRGITIGSLSEN